MLSIRNVSSSGGASSYFGNGGKGSDDYYLDAPDLLDADALFSEKDLNDSAVISAENEPQNLSVDRADEDKSVPDESSPDEKDKKPQDISKEEIDDFVKQKNTIKNSSWFGKGAESQGLEGAINQDDYDRVLGGITPDGVQLGRTVAGENQHRPAVEYAFTPPKSVSVLALVAGDARIIDAHNQAVAETLADIEKNAIQTRVAQNGQTVSVNTGNMIAANFIHTTSRAGDPNLHTHSLIMNMTEKPDGSYGSINFDVMWNDIKELYGEAYSVRLAKKMSELGYVVLAKGKNSEYEIAGVSQEMIDTYSKRRAAIVHAMDELGVEGAKEAEKANVMTRTSKTHLTFSELRDTWKEEAKDRYIDLKQVVEEAKSNAKQFSPEVLAENSKNALHLAIDHMQQREAVFSNKELISQARNFSVGSITTEDLQREYSRLVESGELITDKKQTLLTTKGMLALENDNLLRIEFGKNAVAPIGGVERIKDIQEKYTLNDGQLAAVTTGLYSEDRYIGIQGWPGVGKTVAMAAAKEVVEGQGYQIIGLSPSATAAAQLENESGISCDTMAQFIVNNKDLLDSSPNRTVALAELEKARQGGVDKDGNQVEPEKPMLILVDETSFADTKNINNLLQIAEAMKARVWYIGDRKQLESVDAGKFFEQAQSVNLETAHITEIRRQKNENIREAVYHTIDQRIDKAMELLDVRQVGAGGKKRSDIQTVLNKAVDCYFEQDKVGRENTFFLTTTNEIREAANQLIRAKKIELGEIDHNSVSVTALKSKGFTNTEMRLAQKYESGDMIRFNFEDKSKGIFKGSYYVVGRNDVVINGERCLSLTPNKGGNSIVMSPYHFPDLGGGQVEVFETHRLDIATGDELRWRRNDKTRNIINSETIKVTSVENGQMTFVGENGEERSLSFADYRNRHLDYNYAVTTHASQGGKKDRVIGVFNANNSPLLNQRMLLVQESRAVHEYICFTNDSEKLTEQFIKNTGDSWSSIELASGETDLHLNADEISQAKNNWMTGTLLEAGSAPYQFQKGEKENYFVKIANSKGDEKYVWGIDLSRAIDESMVQMGDEIALRNMGKTEVTVEQNIRDEQGNIVRTETVTAYRNTWAVTKASELEVMAQTEQRLAMAARPASGAAVLDYTAIADLREMLASQEISLEDAYKSLVYSLNGDLAEAQRYMKALGENVDSISARWSGVIDWNAVVNADADSKMQTEIEDKSVSQGVKSSLADTGISSSDSDGRRQAAHDLLDAQLNEMDSTHAAQTNQITNKSINSVSQQRSSGTVSGNHQNDQQHEMEMDI